MFDSLKLFSLTYVTSFGPIAHTPVDFRVLGVKFFAIVFGGKAGKYFFNFLRVVSIFK
jgi:hypothetical protein